MLEATNLSIQMGGVNSDMQSKRGGSSNARGSVGAIGKTGRILLAFLSVR